MKEFNLRTFLRARIIRVRKTPESLAFMERVKNRYPNYDLDHVLGSNKEKINDFTADSEFKEEFMAEELTKNLLELSSDTDDGIVNTTEVTPSEVSLDDLLGDLKLEEPSEMELPEMEPDEKFEELSSFSKELEPDETQIPEAIPLEAELTGENDLENALQKIIDETENNIEKDSEKFAEPGTEVLEVISKSEDLNEIKIDEDIEEPKNADVDFNDYIQDENTIEKIDNAENREFAEIDKIISDLKSEPGDQLSEPENDFVEFDNETFEPEEQPVDSLEVEVPTKLKETLYELKHESKLDEVDLDKTDEENIEPGYYLGLKRKNEESLEWDWGDELKEEFGVEFLKEEELKASKDFEEERHLKDESETIDDFFKIAGHTKPTLFDELESTVKKEIEETRDFEETKNFDETVEPHQVLEYAGEPRRYHFIDEQQPETGITEIRKGSEAGYNFEPMDEVMAEYNENEKGFSFGKTFLIVFSSFVVVVAIIVYMLMNNTEQPKEQADSNAVKDSFSLNEPSNKIDSSQLVVDEYSDFPRVAKLPSKGETSDVKPGNDIGTTSNEPVVQPVTTGPETKNRDLYRTISTETRVSNNIYFDGRQYNFQVSSWKNRYKAEQEVERLRGKGYSAFAVEVYLPQKGGTWFRVRVGNFKSKEEAEQFLSKNTF